MRKCFSESILVCAALFALTYCYLYPGVDLLLAAKKKEVMSDGTDPAALPYAYGQLKYVALNNPIELLYGALPVRMANAPEGIASWMSWSEKIPALIALPIVPLEQVSTAVVILLMIFGGLSTYLMARVAKWPGWVGFGLAICWVFNPFTLARAKVHMAMAGTYHLPLIFLALFALQRWPNKKGLGIATLCFTLASFTLHYFIILTLPFVPLIVLFYYLDEDIRWKWKSCTARLLTAMIPGIMFLGWSVIQPVPQDMVENKGAVYPTTGQFKDESGVHPFLKYFGAHPIDYLGGNIAIGIADWNPLRQQVSEHILSNLESSNPHERASGIRWTTYLLAILTMASIFVGKRMKVINKPNRGYYFYFIVFAIIGFLFSLSPMLGDEAVMPSAWLHRLISQFRVPNRASIFVHFALLMMVGKFIATWAYDNRYHSVKIMFATFLFPIVAVADLPPFINQMPTVPILPRYTALPTNEFCGYGMRFPYVTLEPYYYFAQQMRDSTCFIVNPLEDGPRAEALTKNFGASQPIADLVNSNSDLFKSHLVRYAKCVGLSWIIFDPRIPSEWTSDICLRLGWQLRASDVCVAEQQKSALKNLPENCL